MNLKDQLEIKPMTDNAKLDTRLQMQIAERHMAIAHAHVESAANIGDEAAHLTIACRSYSVAITALMAIIQSHERLLDQVFSNRE